MSSKNNQIHNDREQHVECAVLDDSMTGTKNDVAGVTQFANEACEATQVLADYKPSMYALPQVDIQDIKAYFARPRLISRGTFPFGSSNRIYSSTFAANQGALIAAFPQWSNRLAGAYGIRFTLNFRLQVAATSFHQGILALAWQYSKSVGDTEFFDRGANHYSVTNLPHVRCDISETTMVELSVPFLYPLEFMEIVPSGSNYTFDYGTVSITPLLNSISVAGISPATYDLYLYLTDIQLFGVDAVNPSAITLQSGTDVLSTEIKKSGVVSGTLSNMSKIASFVARGVPSLSAIAGPAAWALDISAGVARYFGYSKPIEQKPTTVMYSTAYGNETHVDMPMHGDVVGLFQSNTTTVDTNLGATEVDEMALRFVLSQWSQVIKGVVATTNTHGTAIYAAPVSPSVFYFRAPASPPFCNVRFPSDSAAITGGNSFFPSSLMYISSFFRQWRGSLKFRITFSKTKLHGGRYMITYNPSIVSQAAINNFGGTVSGPEVVSSLQQPYGNSLIMDLKDGNVFEFNVPYASPVPYLNFVSSSGSLSIVCMDPLQATGTVTTTVPFVVEVCAGDDYELADYAGPYFPLHPSGTITVQSGTEVVKTSTVEPSASTIGEKITSVKQMIMVPNPVRVTATGNATTRLVVAPWFVNVNFNTSNSSLVIPNTANLQFEGSAGASLAPLYAFAKGGTDIHLYSKTNSLTVSVSQIANEYNTGNGNTPSLLRRPFVSSTPKVIQTQGIAVHARLPAFQTVVRVATYVYDRVFGSGVPTSTTGTIWPFISHFAAVNIENVSATAGILTVNRAAADDAMLAHYLGPVPIFVPNSTSTSAVDRNAFIY